MKNILEILDNYIEEQKKKASGNFENYYKLKEQVIRLEEENEMLRKELFELSNELRNGEK